MNENNSIEAIDRTNLTEQTKLLLDEISKIENYFDEEINQRKSCSKKLSKYVAASDYIDKNCFKGNKSWRGKFYFNFFSNNRNSQNITKHNKKKKDHKILMLAKGKLNSNETLISQTLIDMEISLEEFVTILKEKDKHEKMKENLRGENENYEIK